MAVNRGKQFEEKFKRDFSIIPNCSLDRLYDTTNGFKSITNICDFIGYVFPNIFYMEVKSIQGNTFPLRNLTQYSKMVRKVGIKGVRVGVIIWYTEKDRVIYIPIKTITQMIKDQKKSVNIRTIDSDGYRFIDIPSKKKIVFMDSDYSVLLDLEEGD